MTTFSGQPPLTEDAEKDLFGDLAPDPSEEETPDEPIVEPEVEAASEAAETSAEDPQPQTVEDAAPEVEAPETGSEGGDSESEPAAETTSEAQPLVDWKKRYDDIRSSQMASLEQERARAELAEQMLAKNLADMESAKIPQDRLDELIKRAEEQGLDPASVGLYADITSEAVDARTKVYQEALQEQARADQRAVEERQAQAERALVSDFLEAHSDLPETKRPELAKVLHDIGAAFFVDAQGNEVPDMPYEQKLAVGNLKTYEPLTPDILEIAYEAVTNESLGVVLRAMPTLYESDEGMQMARRLASDPALTTQPAPPAAPRKNVDAALAAAETLSGPSAPAPPAEEELFIKPSPSVVFSK